MESNNYNHHHSKVTKYSYKSLVPDDIRRVTAEGAGLYEYVPGETATFRVNTSKAGSLNKTLNFIT
jgi:hypothetical protein